MDYCFNCHQHHHHHHDHHYHKHHHHHYHPTTLRFYVHVIDPSSSSPCLVDCLSYATSEDVSASCVPDLQVFKIINILGLILLRALPLLSHILHHHHTIIFSLLLNPLVFVQRILDQHSLAEQTPFAVSNARGSSNDAAQDNRVNFIREKDQNKFVTGPRTREKVRCPDFFVS